MNKLYWLVIGILLLLVLVLSSCSSRASADVEYEANCKKSGGEFTQGAAGASCRFTTQSFDQENLKKNDKGCPNSVFVAPGGNLRQCP